MPSRQTLRPTSTESKAAEFLTVGWMQTTIATLLCQIGSSIMRWLAVQDGAGPVVTALSGVLLFATLVLGILLLAMTGLVHYLRHQAPPRPITAFAIMLGLLAVSVPVVLVLR